MAELIAFALGALLIAMLAPLIQARYLLAGTIWLGVVALAVSVGSWIG